MRICLSTSLALLGLLTIAGCETVPVPYTQLMPQGPVYPASPYDRYVSEKGDSVFFEGIADPEVPVNVDVIAYSTWDTTGHHSSIRAFNNSDKPWCVLVVWDAKPQNMLFSGEVVVLPPSAQNYVVGYWRTQMSGGTSPGFSYLYWRPRWADASRAPTVQDCRDSRPS